MANMIDLLISTFIVVLAIAKTSVAGMLLPNVIVSNVEQIPFSSIEHGGDDIVRNRRNANNIPNEYYADYYNDYYNNYYNRPSQGYYNNVKPSRPLAVSSDNADRFDRNSFDADDSDNFISSDGTKYVYTPIFKYKSTQQKRHKLFVPNLFG